MTVIIILQAGHERTINNNVIGPESVPLKEQYCTVWLNYINQCKKHLQNSTWKQYVTHLRTGFVFANWFILCFLNLPWTELSACTDRRGGGHALESKQTVWHFFSYLVPPEIKHFCPRIRSPLLESDIKAKNRPRTCRLHGADSSWSQLWCVVQW